MLAPRGWVRGGGSAPAPFLWAFSGQGDGPHPALAFKEGGPRARPGHWLAPWPDAGLPILGWVPTSPRLCVAARPICGRTKRGPRATLSHALHVQINFFIFIRILHILVAKLRAHQMRYSDYKLRWARVAGQGEAGGA